MARPRTVSVAAATEVVQLALDSSALLGVGAVAGRAAPATLSQFPLRAGSSKAARSQLCVSACQCVRVFRSRLKSSTT
jgi:hypothetical protein